MLTPSQKYEVCRVKSGVAYFPIITTGGDVAMGISTRTGNVLISKGDGSSEIPYNPTHNSTSTLLENTINYTSSYSGDFSVKFLNGLKDAFYISLRNHTYNNSKWNIQNLKTFLAQFPNLYALNFRLSAGGNGNNVIKGNLAEIPNTLEIVNYTGLFSGIENITSDIYLNLSSFSSLSLLKFADFPTLKINGDVHNIPSGCYFFKLAGVYAGSSITYTAGKVWASSFDTLSIPLTLTTPELDNLLIDMDNSITTKIGAGVITLLGWRSAASDAAVASLVAKGFTVNVTRNTYGKSVILDTSVIFRIDFQNNYNVWSNSLIDITSGNGVGSEGNLPTFALSGRKAGEYCAVFNGSQSIKTTTNLPINSDKVTIAFWIKKNTQSISATVIYETGNSGTSNLFAGILNASGSNFLSRSRNAGLNENQTAISNNTWIHVVTVIDRSQNGANEIKTYVNGVLATSTKPNSFDNNGNFLNDILFVGQRAGSTAGFEGSLTKLKIYNYPLTAVEVSTLYNSEL